MGKERHKVVLGVLQVQHRVRIFSFLTRIFYLLAISNGEGVGVTNKRVDFELAPYLSPFSLLFL